MNGHLIVDRIAPCDVAAMRLRLSLAGLLVASIWVLTSLLRDYDWQGNRKAWVLLALFCWPVLRLSAVRTWPRFHLTRRSGWLVFGLMFLFVSWFLIRGPISRTGYLNVILVWTGVCALLISKRMASSVVALLGHQKAGLGLLIVLALLQVWLFYGFGKSPDLGDIATTTLAAVKAAGEFRNIYALPIDFHANYPEFAGYKYLPVMVLTYLPLVSAAGPFGLQLTNLILALATALFAGIVAARIRGRFAGVLAGALMLSFPVIPYEIYKHGVTDLAPTAFAMASLAVPRRKATSGFLAGLSIATKLFPGALYALCGLDANYRKFILGAAVGMLPIAAYLALDPHAFLQNTILFITTRPVDESSWMYGAPVEVRHVMTFVYLLTLVGLAALFVFGDADLETRCNLAICAIIFSMLAGPDAHNNYIVWWAPLLCISLAVHAADMLFAGGAQPAGLGGRTLFARPTSSIQNDVLAGD
jgi:hypothetical protein